MRQLNAPITLFNQPIMVDNLVGSNFFLYFVKKTVVNILEKFKRYSVIFCQYILRLNT